MANVILAGGTGLTGGLAIPMLADAGHQLYVIGRREISGLDGGIKQIIAPAEQWAQEIAKLKLDAAISCLGSTIKKAGSREAFAKIDIELLHNFAAAAQKSGAHQMITISSAMADSGASSAYLKMKGEAEDGLRAMNFSRLDIIRPGLLLGNRGEFRLGEGFGALIFPLVGWMLAGRLNKFRAIEASDVARAISSLIAKPGEGAAILHNEEIWELARR